MNELWEEALNVARMIDFLNDHRECLIYVNLDRMHETINAYAEWIKAERLASDAAA